VYVCRQHVSGGVFWEVLDAGYGFGCACAAAGRFAVLEHHGVGRVEYLGYVVHCSFAVGVVVVIYESAEIAVEYLGTLVGRVQKEGMMRGVLTASRGAAVVTLVLIEPTF
jgi:hypothetical protein